MRLIDAGWAGTFFVDIELDETSANPWHRIWFDTAWEALAFIDQWRNNAAD